MTPTKRTPTRTHKGGAPWRKYDRLVRRLDAQPQWHAIGVLFDLYGCPADTPGYRAHGSGPEYHREVSAAVDESFRGVSGRVRPYAILHEFETLVLAAIDAGAHGHLPASARADLRAQVVAVGEVELVNGGRTTSPSHRILTAWPGYGKTVDGVDLIDEAGLDAVLASCPTFAAWLSRLLA